jgi:hypothetical protein
MTQERNRTAPNIISGTKKPGGIAPAGLLVSSG